MADDEEVTIETAGEKPARAKRAKPMPGEEGFKPDHRGPQPHFPSYGESWEDNEGKVKFWDGKSWYLNPPRVSPEERGEALREKAIDELHRDQQNAEIEGDAEDQGDAALNISPGEEREEPAEEVVETVDEVDEITGEVVETDVDSDEVSLSVQRMEDTATDFELGETKFLVAGARDFLLEQIKMRPKPWSATSEKDQIDVAAACEHAAVELVRKIKEALATEGKQPIRALLESYVEKDGIKVSLKVKTFSDEEALAAIVGLHNARGKHVMITVASVDDYRGDRPAATDPDQPGLGFEAGNDAYDGDDSDLAGDDNEAEDDADFEAATDD